jgi:ParB family chromosome partitioning protein
MSKTVTADAAVGSDVLRLDPRSLLVDRNIREVRLDPDFVGSIKERGVLVPITAVRTADGQVRVRLGHRRTLGAIQADQATVPVQIAGNETEDDAATIDRIIDQHAENAHRDGLTISENVGVAAQLALLGVSAAQIAKRTRMARGKVDAALDVAGSELAMAATSDYDLTLDQAATLAEFDADPEVVTALIDAAKTGRFAHAAQRARDDRKDAARKEAFAQSLRETGITVIDGHTLADTTSKLTSLVDAQGGRLTAENHADCPGHAVYGGTTWGYMDPTTGAQALDQDDDEFDDDDDSEFEDDQDDDDDEAQSPKREWGQCLTAVAVCTDYAANGHRIPVQAHYGVSERPKMADLPPQEQEAARALRRDVIESNKGWRAAETVRRDWLRTFLSRKTAPKGTSAFVGTALARDAATIASIGGNNLAAELLGCGSAGYGRSTDLAALITKATEARAQVLILAQGVAAYEDATDTNSWRHVNDGIRRYLIFIAANGYALDSVERRACGQDPLPEETTPAA